MSPAQDKAAETTPKLFIASDHAGFDLKAHLLRVWKDKVTLTSPVASPGKLSWTWKDLGPANADRVDYPDFAQNVCRELLLAPKGSFGILVCGSGQGMAMTANRFKGVRAALTWNEESTRLSRAHNDANILCLGARLIEPSLAVNLVEIFLRTPFEGARHVGRINKIEC